MSILTGPMNHRLDGHKDLTKHKDVLKTIDPDQVWIPLVIGNAPCKACVSVGDEVKVKAAGGIRTLDDALAYVEAGVSRIGTSAGVKIIKEYDERAVR